LIIGQVTQLEQYTMTTRTITLNDRLYDYLLAHSLRETPEMRELRALTAEMSMSRMQIAPEQGQFMALLVELIGARSIVEIGTFTGYSALCMARALPIDGRIVCCDISTEWTDIAREFWERAGVYGRIDLQIAPALETLDALLAGGAAGTFDMAFVDADKANYPTYYEHCLSLVRQGGLLLFDNTLWSGAVADPDDQSEDTTGIRRLNDQLCVDERISLSVVPIGDGLTLARKR
jgi:predicted O-methyltransferase YrrM